MLMQAILLLLKSQCEAKLFLCFLQGPDSYLNPECGDHTEQRLPFQICSNSRHHFRCLLLSLATPTSFSKYKWVLFLSSKCLVSYTFFCSSNNFLLDESLKHTDHRQKECQQKLQNNVWGAFSGGHIFRQYSHFES